MERWLIEQINLSWTSPVLDPVMVGLTTIGLVGLPLAAALQWRAHRRLWRALLIALGLSLAATLCLQWLTARPRPSEVRLILAQPGFFAYPSGHVAIAVCTAVLMWLVGRRHGRVGKRVWVGFLVSAGIAYSRVYLGHHHPGDLLPGAILGAAVAAACYGLLVATKRDWRWLVWPQVAVAVVITHIAYMDLLPRHLLTWPHADKVFHFLLFGAIVFWLDLWLGSRRVARIPAAIALPLALATIEEVAQHLSPHRTADIGDLACDLAGMLFFFWLSRRLRPRLLGPEGDHDGGLECGDHGSGPEGGDRLRTKKIPPESAGLEDVDENGPARRACGEYVLS